LKILTGFLVLLPVRLLTFSSAVIGVLAGHATLQIGAAFAFLLAAVGASIDVV